MSPGSSGWTGEIPHSRRQFLLHPSPSVLLPSSHSSPKFNLNNQSPQKFCHHLLPPPHLWHSRFSSIKPSQSLSSESHNSHTGGISHSHADRPSTVHVLSHCSQRHSSLPHTSVDHTIHSRHTDHSSTSQSQSLSRLSHISSGTSPHTQQAFLVFSSISQSQSLSRSSQSSGTAATPHTQSHRAPSVHV